MGGKLGGVWWGIHSPAYQEVWCASQIPSGVRTRFRALFECHSTIIMKFELYESHLELFELLSCENEVQKGQ